MACGRQSPGGVAEREAQEEARGENSLSKGAPLIQPGSCEEGQREDPIEEFGGRRCGASEKGERQVGERNEVDEMLPADLVASIGNFSSVILVLPGARGAATEELDPFEPDRSEINSLEEERGEARVRAGKEANRVAGEERGSPKEGHNGFCTRVRAGLDKHGKNSTPIWGGYATLKV